MSCASSSCINSGCCGKTGSGSATGPCASGGNGSRVACCRSSWSGTSRRKGCVGMVGSGTCCGTEPGADTGLVDVINLRPAKLWQRPTSGAYRCERRQNVTTFLVVVRVEFRGGRARVGRFLAAGRLPNGRLRSRPRDNARSGTKGRRYDRGRQGARRSALPTSGPGCVTLRCGDRNSAGNPGAGRGYPIAGVGRQFGRGVADLWGKFLRGLSFSSGYTCEVRRGWPPEVVAFRVFPSYPRIRSRKLPWSAAGDLRLPA
jgi:hypothetical protein